MIKGITVSQQIIQLRAPFVTALRKVDSYPVIQVKVELESGEIGVGECVATPQISGDSFDGILQDLNSPAVQSLQNLDPEEIAALPIYPSARAALDMARWSLQKSESITVKTDVTVPIAPLIELPRIVKERLQAGFVGFKVKVEQEPLVELLERIAIIREFAGENCLIRIDPNQAWELDYAILAAEKLAETGANIEYLEQPLNKNDLAGHGRLSQQSPIALMADESCFSLKELDEVLAANAFQYLNVKLLKAGGVYPALELAKQARAAGLQVSIGSMMEGELGIKAAIYVAAQIAPEVVHDLDAAWWIANSGIKYLDSRVSS